MTDNPQSTPTELIWDVGTAYELFVSLQVLHEPEHYGLRAAWAAGIRSRIPAAERKFLEEVIPFLGFPLGWVYQLPHPKDAISVLWALKQISPAKRLRSVIRIDAWQHEKIKAVYLRIYERGVWDKNDLTELEAEKHEKSEHEKTIVKNFLGWWVQPEESGNMLLSALQVYQQAFFEEEEKRVAPVLEAGLKRAQELAERMSIPDLIVELSQGVHFTEKTKKQLIIIPAYWTTPLVLLENIGNDQSAFLFGARPATMSATPGELVPDGLLRALKALSDSTRLKILYYLSKEELTPSELARRLHLRAPTVTHHLSELRLAGLVNLTAKGQEKFYSTRREALQNTFANLETFLDNE
jgi:DNA-binding transcriptional ArsR family regulator